MAATKMLLKMYSKMQTFTFNDLKRYLRTNKIYSTFEFSNMNT